MTSTGPLSSNAGLKLSRCEARLLGFLEVTTLTLPVQNWVGYPAPSEPYWSIAAPPNRRICRLGQVRRLFRMPGYTPHTLSAFSGQSVMLPLIQVKEAPPMWQESSNVPLAQHTKRFQ